MRLFFVAILMVGFCFWSEAVASEEDPCSESTVPWSSETEVVGHEVLDQIGDFTEVRFNLAGFIPGNVNSFQGWMSKDVFDRQCLNETNLSAITTGIYFHSDGVDGRFQEERLRLFTYIKENQKPGELLIVISRPHGFDLTPISHGQEIDAQAMLVAYLDHIFGLGESVELYGHGAETIAVALRVNREYPKTVKRVTGFTRINVREQGQDAYYFLLFKRIENMVNMSGGSDLEINLSYNQYDEFGQEEIEGFVVKVNDLGFNIVLNEMAEVNNQVISDGSIAQEILAEIKDQLLLNQAYARKHLGIAPWGTKVYIGNDPVWLADRYLEAIRFGESNRSWRLKHFRQPNPPPEAGFYGVIIPAYNNNNWQKGASARANTIAHEWWHTVQIYLLNSLCCSGSDRMQHTGPAWLIEGSADIWARVMLSANVEEQMNRRRENLRNRMPADFNLLDLNTRRGWTEASYDYKYHARQLAIYMLMETSGLQGFLDFYGKLGDYYAGEAAQADLDSTGDFGGYGSGSKYRLAQFSREFFDLPERLEKLDEIFQSAFGRTMDEFAEEFRNSIH